MERGEKSGVKISDQQLDSVYKNLKSFDEKLNYNKICIYYTYENIAAQVR